jgi:23S rRNA pseudouridine1911/1915/1917 synthase
MTEYYTADFSDIGLRLDVFLACRGNQSRSVCTQWIAEGRVTCDGKPCKPSHKVTDGLIVSVTPPQARPSGILAQQIDLDILFEDDEFLVINKPKGMVVHPAPGHPDGTMVNALLHHCGESLTGVGGVLRPGIVHRLDKDTSGLILAAKTQFAHTALSAALKARTIQRVYQAVVHGAVKQDCGTVNAPVGRHPVKRKQMAVVANGRPAVTHFSVLRRYAKHTHVSCCLETGRTHQIRVHMASVNHPVMGDPLYGPKTKQPYTQCLHSFELTLAHPLTGKFMTFSSPLPDYFTDILSKLP